MIVSRGALVNWLNLHASTVSFSTCTFPQKILEEFLKTSEPLTTVGLPQMWSTRSLVACKRSWRGWTRSWAPSGPLARRTMGEGCSTSQTVSTLPTYSGWSLYDFFGTAVLVDSVGWSCISDILEWFFLKKHYHGHHFPPQPPQSLPPSLISYLRESSCLLSQKYQALRSNNMQNCIFARTSATWFYWKWKFTITTTSQVITKI